MSRPILSEQLIDVLRQAGVERVYGVAGDSLNPLLARANLRNIPVPAGRR
jgi:thiamine pyrophosphate-dependent acetolactate synthase large subunit-like protein